MGEAAGAALEAPLRVLDTMPNTVEVEAAAHQTHLATLDSLAVRLYLAQVAAVREEPVAAVLVTLVEPGAVIRQAEAVLLVGLRLMAATIPLDAGMAAAEQLVNRLAQAAMAVCQAAEEAAEEERQVLAQVVLMGVQADAERLECGLFR